MHDYDENKGLEFATKCAYNDYTVVAIDIPNKNISQLKHHQWFISVYGSALYAAYRLLIQYELSVGKKNVILHNTFYFAAFALCLCLLISFYAFSKKRIKPFVFSESKNFFSNVNSEKTEESFICSYNDLSLNILLCNRYNLHQDLAIMAITMLLRLSLIALILAFIAVSFFNIGYKEVRGEPPPNNLGGYYEVVSNRTDHSLY